MVYKMLYVEFNSLLIFQQVLMTITHMCILIITYITRCHTCWKMFFRHCLQAYSIYVYVLSKMLFFSRKQLVIKLIVYTKIWHFLFHTASLWCSYVYKILCANNFNNIWVILFPIFIAVFLCSRSTENILEMFQIRCRQCFMYVTSLRN